MKKNQPSKKDQKKDPKKDLNKLFQQLKNFKDADVAKIAASGKADEKLAENEVITLGLMRRIAQQCSFEDFEAFVTKAEVPPLKLTNQEQAALSGGEYDRDSGSETLSYWVGRIFGSILRYSTTMEPLPRNQVY